MRKAQVASRKPILARCGSAHPRHKTQDAKPQKIAAMRKLVLILLVSLTPLWASPSVLAQSGSSGGAVAALMRLLESGRLPPSRQGPALRLLCQRGGPKELAYAFAVALDAKRPVELRAQVLEELATAARQRKLRPAGDLTRLRELLDQSPELRLQAVRLAGLWQVRRLASSLGRLAAAKGTPAPLRQAAIEALQNMKGPEAKAALEHLAREADDLTVRMRALGALVPLDTAQAARLAAELIPVLDDRTDPAPLLQPFLDRRGGSKLLAQALRGKKLPADAARLVLRYLYSVGRSDAELVQVLSEAAGIDLSKPPFTEKDLPALIAEVNAEGDPVRGEMIFRRKDLSCTKCHAINHVGGNIGPDLGAVGASSPVDYILRSILFPNQAIKEQYKTKVIITAQGQVITGIQVSRDDQKVVLKTAEGQLRTVPVADIEEEAEGRSLMPEGLTRFLTRRELVDLAAFLSRLGKPGPWAIPQVPVLRNWQVLVRPRPEVVQQVPDEFLLQKKVLATPPKRWQPVLGLVRGDVLLEEAAQVARSPVVYLRTRLNVLRSGPAVLEVQGGQLVSLWLDGKRLPSGTQVPVELARGRHELLLRADVRQLKRLRVRVLPRGSSGAVVQEVPGP